MFSERCADAAVLIGDKSDHFFGLPAINITNGVNVDEFSFQRRPGNSGEIVLVGVAGTLWWQAYDRVLGRNAHLSRKKKTGGSAC
jgi:hypothetical protein